MKLKVIFYGINKEEEILYLTMHSTHFAICDRYMVKPSSDREETHCHHYMGFLINGKGSFICTIQ